MVAIVAGGGLGLFNTSLNTLGGQGGQSRLGQTTGAGHVNVATGNLVLQSGDEQLSGRGLDLFHLRTYNAQGLLSDADADGWRWDGERRVDLAGTLNTTGSTVTRTAGDGSQTVYVWDASSSRYVSTDGDGAHDVIVWEAANTRWSWTDGSRRVTEYYTGSTGRLASVLDASGNTITYTYNAAGQLSSVKDVAGQEFVLVYDAAGRLERLDTRTTSGGALSRQVYYSYDASGRLSTVTTDLTPGDNSIADGNVYTTTYTYDGSSFRIASISQGDGTTVSFTYAEQGGVWRVSSVTDQGGITTFTYDAVNRRTDVTNGLNQQWSYFYDTQGRLIEQRTPAVNGQRLSTSYTYDADGNVTQVADGLGNIVRYEYDAHGNRLLERDAQGGTILRQYDSANQLTNETRYAAAATAVPQLTWGNAFDTDTSGLTFSDAASPGLYRDPATGRLVFRSAYSETSSFPRLYENASRPQGDGTLYRMEVATGAMSLNRYLLIGVVSTGHRHGVWLDGSQLKATWKENGVDQSIVLGTLADNTSYVFELEATAGGTTVYFYEQGQSRSSGYVHRRNDRDRGDLKLNMWARVNPAFNGTSEVYVDNLSVSALGWSAPDPATALTRRHVYDANSRLRFAVSAEGTVSEYRYNSFGQLTAEILYNCGRYPVAGLLTTDTLSEADLTAWIATQTQTNNLQRSDFTYDYRGNLTKRTDFSSISSGGGGTLTAEAIVTEYVYSEHGQLLQTIAVRGASRTEKTVQRSVAYDGLGRVLAEADASGTRTSVYDGVARTLSVTTAAGLTQTQAFDSLGRLISVTETAASETARQSQYVYDAAGRLVMTQDALGVRSYVFYDDAGRVSGRVDGIGAVTEFGYDANGRLLQEIRYATTVDTTSWFNGTTVVPATVAAIRPTASTHDRSIQYGYDAAGRLISSTDAAGTTSISTYDAAGRLVQVSSGDRVIRHFHDRDGRLLGSLDAEGFLSENIYSPAGRLLEARRYAMATTAALRATGTLADLRATAGSHRATFHFYDPAGRLIGTRDEKQFFTEYKYDEALNTQQVIRYTNTYTSTVTTATAFSTIRNSVAAGGSQTTTVQYDAMGRVLQRTAPNGAISRMEYDTAGRLVRETAAFATTDARDTRLQYDAFGQVTGRLSGEAAALVTEGMSAGEVAAVFAQHGLRYVYDAAGRVARSIDSTGRTTVHYYDANGRLTHTVNNAGEVRESTYTTFGEVATSTAFNARLDETALAAQQQSGGGLLTTPVNALVNAIRNAQNDSHTQFSYTSRGLLASQTDAEGKVTQYGYDAFGQLETETRPIGAGGSTVIRHVYNKRGERIRSIEDEGGLNLTRHTEYDAFGRITKQIDAAGKITTTAYESNGRIIAVTDPVSHVRRTEYDAYDRLLRVTDAMGSVTTYSHNVTEGRVTVTSAEGVAVSTFSNRHGETVRVVDGRGGETLYTYNRNGQLLTVTDALGSVTTSNTYSTSTWELTSSTDALGNVISYSYDAAGRVLTRSNTATNAVTRYAFDGQGRQVAMTEAEGSASERTTVYAYDRNGRVLTVTLDPAGLALTTTYSYDDAGRQLSVARGTIAAPAQQLTTYTYDAAGRRLSETQDPTGLALTTQYRYDQEGRLSRKIDALGHSTWYVYDAAGMMTYSINALGEATRYYYDGNQRVISTVRYAAKLSTASFGDVVTTVSLSTSSNDIRSWTVYDRDGRACYQIDGLGQVSEFRYDANGNVIETVRHDGRLPMAENLHWQNNFDTDLSGIGSTTNLTTYPDILRYENGRIVLRSPDGTTAAPGLTTAIRSYEAGIRYTAELTLGATLPKEILLDVSNSLSSAGTSPLHRRHGLSLLNGKLYASYYTNTSGGQTVLLGDAQANTTYVIDIETHAAGTTLYVYAQGQTRESPGVMKHELTATGWTQVQFRMLGYRRPGYDGAEAYVDNLKEYRPATTEVPGLKTRSVYDALNRKRYEVDPQGLVTEWRYDAGGNITAKVQHDTALAAVTPMTEAAVQAALADLAANGAHEVATQYIYDAAGRLVYTVNALRQVTQQVHDHLGRVTAIYHYEQALAEGIALTQSTIAQVLSPIDAAKRETTFLHDKADRTTFQKNGDSPLLRYFDPLGRVVSEVRLGAAPSSVSAAMLYSYDAVGRQRFSLDAGLHLTERSYDANGRVIAETRYARLAAMPTSEAELASMLAAYGNDQKSVTRYVYDDVGRLRFTIDAEGAVTENIYDSFGSIISVRQHHEQLDITQSYGSEQDVVAALEQAVVWSTDLENPAQSGLVVSGGATTGTRIENGGLIVQKTHASSTYNPTFYEAISRAYTQGHTYSFEVRTSSTVADSYMSAGIQNDQPYSTVANHPFRRHLAVFINGALSVNRRDASGMRSVALGTYKADTTYIVEVELTAEGTMLYVYEQGTSRSAGWSDFQAAVDWGVVRFQGYGQSGPSLSGPPIIIDNLALRDNQPANDNATRYLRDAEGRVRFSVDAAGYVSERIHDVSGRIVQERRYAVRPPAGLLMSMASVQAWAAAQSEATAQATTYLYDNSGRERFVVDALGYVTENVYDGLGRIVEKRKSPVAISVALAADTLPSGTVHIRARQDALLAAAGAAAAATGHQYVQMAYDDLGRLRFLTDQLGNVTETVYNRHGEVVATGRHISPTEVIWTQHAYDKNGRLRFSVDALGYVKEIRYDALGYRVAEIAYAEPVMVAHPPTESELVAAVAQISALSARITHLINDALGRVRYTINALGQVAETRYDGLGRVERNTQYALVVPASVARNEQAIGDYISSQAPAARHTVYGYDQLGRLTSTTDALNHTESYTYDAYGNRKSLTNKLGKVWTYAYDALNRLTEEATPSVTVQSDWRASTQRTGNLVTQLAYDAFGNLISRSEGNVREGGTLHTDQARVTRYGYDALNRMVVTIQPGYYDSNAGAFQALALTPAERATAINPGSLPADPAGGFLVTTQVTYDAFGRAVRNRQRVANSGDAATDYVDTFKVYDALDQVRYEIDALRQVTGYAYDSRGNQIQMTRYAQALAVGMQPNTQGYYTLDALVVTQDAANDRTLTTEYDALNRKVSVRQNVTALYHHAAGTMQAAPTTRYVYDGFGQLVQEVREARDGNNVLLPQFPAATTTHYYNVGGQRIAMVDAMGYLTRYYYDNYGQLREQTEYATALSGWSATTVPWWDPADLAGKNRTTAFTYDDLGRTYQVIQKNVSYYQNTAAANQLPVFAVQTGDLVTSTTTYDAQGNVKTQADAASNITTMVYNDAGLLQQVIEPERTTARAGAIDPFLSPTVKASPTITYALNAFGQIVQETHAAGVDAQGNVQMGVTRINRMGYDAAGNDRYSIAADIDTALLTAAGSNFTSVHGVTNYKVDAQGRRIEDKQTVSAVFTAWTGNTGYQHDIRRTYTYDKAGRQTEVSDWYLDNGVLKATTQKAAYNSFGEVTQKHLNHVLQSTHVYNQLGQSVQTTDSNGVTVIEYDHLGNATRQTQRGDLSTTADDRISTFKYDLLGRTLEQRLPAFSANLSADTLNSTTLTKATPIVSFTYDRWGNKLSETTGAYRVDGASTDTTTSARTTIHDYDHGNRLLRTTQPEVEMWREHAVAASRIYTASPVQAYQYDKLGNLLREEHSTSVDATVLRGRSKEYNEVGQLVREVDATNNQRFYRVDAFGNRVALKNGVGLIFRSDYDQQGRVTSTYSIAGSNLELTFATEQEWNDYSYSGEHYSINKVAIMTGTPHRPDYIYKAFVFRPGVYQVNETRHYDQAGRLYASVRGSQAVEEDIRTYHDVTGLSTQGDNRVVSFVVGNVRYSVYDARGNQVTTRNESKITKTFQFDEMNRKTRETDGLGNYLSWEYDNLFYGRLKASYHLAGVATTNHLLPQSYVMHYYNSFGQVSEDYFVKDGVGHMRRKREYYENGLEKSVTDSQAIIPHYHAWPIDKVVATTTQYNIIGNVTSMHNHGSFSGIYYEGYAPDGYYVYESVTNDTFSNQQRYKYDALGRLIETKSPTGTAFVGTPTTSEYYNDGYEISLVHSVIKANLARVDSLQYKYDALGNRMHVYLDTVNQSGTQKIVEEYNKYDAEGRLIVSDGALNTAGKIVAMKNKGYALTYDGEGRRASIEKWHSHLYYQDVFDQIHVGERFEVQSYAYDYQGNLTFIGSIYGSKAKHADSSHDYVNIYKPGSSTTVIYASYESNYRYLLSAGYDAAGNRTSETQYDASGNLKDQTVSTYRGDSNIVSQTTYRKNGRKNQATFFDELGTVNIVNGVNTYGGVAMRDAAGNQLSYRYVVYKDTTANDRNYLGKYESKYEGYTSYKEKETTVSWQYKSGTPGKTTFTYAVDGELLAAVGAGGNSFNRRFASDRSGLLIARRDGSSTGNAQNYVYYKGSQLASVGKLQTPSIIDTFAPATKELPDTQRSSYFVQEGDTLERIAFAVYGDARLWYAIADANGLTSDADLANLVGGTLRIPDLISGSFNSADTLKPYNPADVIGNTTPAPLPPPPKKNCAATVIMIVVAVVASVLTAGAAATFFAGGLNALAGASLSSLAAAGTTAMLGGGVAASAVLGSAAVSGMTVSAAIGGALIGGAVGSAASQLAGKAMGVVDKFSWRQVAAGGLTAAFSAGMSGIGMLRGAQASSLMAQGKQAMNWAQYVNGVLQGAVLNTASSYAASKIAKLDNTPTWGSVGISAIGSFAGHALGQGNINTYVSDQAGAALSARIEDKWFGGARPDYVQVAAAALGNSIGQSIVSSITAPYIKLRKAEIEQERLAAANAIRRDQTFEKLSKRPSIDASWDALFSLAEHAERGGKIEKWKPDSNIDYGNPANIELLQRTFALQSKNGVVGSTIVSANGFNMAFGDDYYDAGGVRHEASWLKEANAAVAVDRHLNPRIITRGDVDVAKARGEAGVDITGNIYVVGVESYEAAVAWTNNWKPLTKGAEVIEAGVKYDGGLVDTARGVAQGAAYRLIDFASLQFMSRRDARVDRVRAGTLSHQDYARANQIDAIATVGTLYLGGVGGSRIAGFASGRLATSSMTLRAGAGVAAAGAGLGAVTDVALQGGQMLAHQATNGATGQSHFNPMQTLTAGAAGGVLAPVMMVGAPLLAASRFNVDLQSPLYLQFSPATVGMSRLPIGFKSPIVPNSAETLANSAINSALAKRLDVYKAWKAENASAYASNADAMQAYRRLVRSESPWPDGFTPMQTVIEPGTQFRMALSPGQSVNRPGGFATLDEIPNVDYVRNQLAVKEGWKPQVDRVVTYEVVQPLPSRVGPVGPQADLGAGRYLPGGGSQIQLDIPARVRMDYLRVIDVTNIK